MDNKMKAVDYLWESIETYVLRDLKRELVQHYLRPMLTVSIKAIPDTKKVQVLLTFGYTEYGEPPFQLPEYLMPSFFTKMGGEYIDLRDDLLRTYESEIRKKMDALSVELYDNAIITQPIYYFRRPLNPDDSRWFDDFDEPFAQFLKDNVKVTLGEYFYEKGTNAIRVFGSLIQNDFADGSSTWYIGDTASGRYQEGTASGFTTIEIVGASDVYIETLKNNKYAIKRCVERAIHEYKYRLGATHLDGQPLIETVPTRILLDVFELGVKMRREIKQVSDEMDSTTTVRFKPAHHKSGEPKQSVKAMGRNILELRVDCLVDYNRLDSDYLPETSNRQFWLTMPETATSLSGQSAGRYIEMLLKSESITDSLKTIADEIEIRQKYVPLGFKKEIFENYEIEKGA